MLIVGTIGTLQPLPNQSLTQMALGLFPLLALIVGLISAANVFIARMPNAKQVIDKISPYQATLGLVALVWAILALVSWAGMPGRMGFVTNVTSLVCLASSIVAGFLLGFPLLQTYIFDDMSENARRKSDNLRKALLPFHVLAGLTAFGSGIYLFLFVTIPYLF